MSLDAALEANAQLAERGQPGVRPRHHPPVRPESIIAFDATTVSVLPSHLAYRHRTKPLAR